MSTFKRRKQKANLFNLDHFQGPLTLAERDTLADLDPDILRALFKDMSNVVKEWEDKLISFQYRPGKEDELHFIKTKATGAREFFNSYVRRLEEFKQKLV